MPERYQRVLLKGGVGSVASNIAFSHMPRGCASKLTHASRSSHSDGELKPIPFQLNKHWRVYHTRAVTANQFLPKHSITSFPFF